MIDDARRELNRQLAEVFMVSNPSVEPTGEARRTRPPRVPMSSVRRKLEVRPIPGYHMHWFKEENIPGAMDAYYEFVKRGEVSLNPTSFGSDVAADGNSDMGTNVSIVAGTTDHGVPIRLTLMKLRQEYFNEDQQDLETRNSRILQAIFGDEAMFGRDGQLKAKDPLTYVNKERTGLFNRPTRKAQIGKRGR